MQTSSEFWANFSERQRRTRASAVEPPREAVGYAATPEQCYREIELRPLYGQSYDAQLSSVDYRRLGMLMLYRTGYYTLRDLASLFGISPDRVRQIRNDGERTLLRVAPKLYYALFPDRPR